MNDIRPPKKPASVPQAIVAPVALPPIEVKNDLPLQPKRRRGKIIGLIVAVVILIMAGAVGVGYVWYVNEQKPVSTSTKQIRVVIKSGEQPADIARSLKQNGLIRSVEIFDWYTKLHGSASKLQAGVYSLSPNMPLSEIVSHLTTGKTDTITITFLPGATLDENKKVLQAAGYSTADIEAATTNQSQYHTSLFTGKPAAADFEGYIYGETYEFPADVTVHDILQRTFDEYESVIKKNDLEAAFKAHGLTLYQGIILSSIVQREMSSHTKDMPQVAQVFLLRLREDMPLGSDVTFEYGAKKLGVAATPQLDSAYNTRIHAGLPPGPIATPGLDALLAVAHPAKGRYLFFLSGDDGITYFATTSDGHEQNIAKHCQKQCFSN